MKRVLVLIVLCFLLVGVRAQDTTKLTLQECVRIALENNLRVRRGFYNVESFEINKVQSLANFFPTLNVGGANGLNYGRALNPVTNAYVNRNSNTINIQGTASLTLFNGLRVTNAFLQSLKDVDASNYDLTKAKNDVIVNVVTLYTNVIFSQELYENAQFQLNSSQQQVDRIKKQVDAGALPISNQLNQEAQVATNEVNLINQENALNLALLQLKQAMQIPGSTLISVVIPDIKLEEMVLDQTPEQIYKVAYQVMPEIQSALLKIQSAQLALKAARGSLYPRINLNASAQSNYSSISNGPRYTADAVNGPFITTTQQIGVVNVNGVGQPVLQTYPVPTLVANKYTQGEQLRDNLFKGVSIQLNVPIFNNFSTRTNVQRAVITQELANITARETENTLRQTIETAYNDAVSASKSYAANLKQVSARQEAYRITKQRFDNGAANFVEYNISENDLFAARSDLARAKYNFIFKKKLLDFYLGKSIEY